MTAIFRWTVLAIISSALFMVVIDMTVLYTALPRLTHDLMASASQKLWIVNAYPLTMAGLLITMGTLNDRYGAHLFFNGGLVIFGVASVMAAYAPTPEFLIFSRGILAIGAAAMLPATLAIVRRIFTDAAERSLAIGIWSAVASGGAALGPVIGGVLLEHFWWGSVFLINLPVVLLTLILAIKLIPAIPGDVSRRFSVVAAGQILLGIIATMYAMKEFSNATPRYTVLLLSGVVGVVMIYFFVRGQKSARHPMLDLSLFNNRLFSAGVIAAVVATATVIGLELVITQRLQLILGLSPLQAGVALLPLPLASFFAGPLVGYIIPRLGSVPATLGALLISAVGTAAYLFGYDQGTWIAAGCLSLIGAGLGGAMTAASTAIMLNSPEESAGTAASIEGVAYEAGGSIGIAVLGGILTMVYMHFMQDLPAIPAIAKDSIDGALLAAGKMAASEGEILRNLASHAFMQAFFAVMIISIAALLVTCISLSGWARLKSRSSESTSQ